jgi:hypothetical protein
MMKKNATTSLAAMALLGFCAVSNSVSAAELVKLEGKVSVNRGDGFGPATLGMVLKPGDQVLVGNEGAASLVYAEPGCVFDVPEASLVTVSEVGPCIPGQTTVLGQSALAMPTATHDDDDDRLLPFFIMGGGAVIGATAFIINEASSNNNNNGNGNGNGGGFGGVSRP